MSYKMEMFTDEARGIDFGVRAEIEMAVLTKEQVDYVRGYISELQELVRMFALWERDAGAMCGVKCPIGGECGEHDDCMFVDWAIGRARELGAEVEV